MNDKIKELEDTHYRFVAVLTILLELKDHKDAFGKDEHYLMNQPIAWANARNLLNKDQNERI